MRNRFYSTLEGIRSEESVVLQECISQLSFSAQGLIPVIAQCHSSGLVLMQAWMNREAIEKTLLTGRMTYWSRSRNSFWVKGETSGHTQKLINLRFDCDGDAILCAVEQAGAACHTGRSSCFYLQADVCNNTVRLALPNPTT